MHMQPGIKVYALDLSGEAAHSIYPIYGATPEMILISCIRMHYEVMMF